MVGSATLTLCGAHDAALQDIDAGLRRLLNALPANLRSRDLPRDAFPLARPSASAVHASRAPSASDAPEPESTDVVVRQRIRLAMHFCMLFCKPCDAAALF